LGFAGNFARDQSCARIVPFVCVRKFLSRIKAAADRPPPPPSSTR
jgi:hypothetical protein